MRVNTRFVSLLILLLTVVSCKKNREHCWQLVDALGNEMGVVCDKSLSEMQSLYPNPCTYYKVEGDEHCWLINGTYFLKNATESRVNHMLQCYYSGNPQKEKVDCNYCQTWYTREKRTYKPNNTFSYTSVRSQQYCGDTVNTLFQGREIILRETTDSLIIIQFSSSGIF